MSVPLTTFPSHILPWKPQDSGRGAEGPCWRSLEQDKPLPSASLQAQKFCPARLPGQGQTLLGARSPEGAKLREHPPWGSSEQVMSPTRDPKG